MEVNVGDSVEAVDQLGIWAKAKVVRKADNAVVVNFPPWKAEWDREICDPSEIREQTLSFFLHVDYYSKSEKECFIDFVEFLVAYQDRLKDFWPSTSVKRVIHRQTAVEALL